MVATIANPTMKPPEANKSFLLQSLRKNFPLMAIGSTPLINKLLQTSQPENNNDATKIFMALIIGVILGFIINRERGRSHPNRQEGVPNRMERIGFGDNNRTGESQDPNSNAATPSSSDRMTPSGKYLLHDGELYEPFTQANGETGWVLKSAMTKGDRLYSANNIARLAAIEAEKANKEKNLEELNSESTPDENGRLEPFRRFVKGNGEFKR